MNFIEGSELTSQVAGGCFLL